MRIGTYADGFTSDGHGAVGEVVQGSGIIALTGFSGHGFKLAPILGEIGAELAIENDSGLQIEQLRLARLSERAGLRA